MLSLIRIGLSLHTNQSIMSHDLLHYPCWDPKLDCQTEREKVSFGQIVQHRGMICTIVIALYLHQVFNPVQCWVGGIYTPNLITVFLECPSGYYLGQEITSGVFGNFTRYDSPN